jgi:hypothetical protein
MQEAVIPTGAEFDVPYRTEIVQDRISEYLLLAGYAPDGQNRYERGSLMGTIWALTPLNWRSLVTIECTPTNPGTHVRAVYDVNTTGRLITAREMMFWKTEVAGLERAANGSVISSNLDRAQKASRENARSMGVFFGLLILMATALVILMMLVPRPLIWLPRSLFVPSVMVAGWLWLRYRRRLNDRVLREEGRPELSGDLS